MFSWFGGKTKSNLPETTALQLQRARQIEQLKVFNQSVSEIQRDVVYCVNTVVKESTISLWISLPHQFPQEKPVVKVTPRLAHPWVNDQMIIVGAPGLNNFVVHSNLGKVIREIIQEFHRNPPTLLPQQCGYPSYPFGTCPSAASASNSPPLATQPSVYCFPQQTVQQKTSIPSYISSIPVSVAGGVPAVTTAYSSTGEATDVEKGMHSQAQSNSNVPGEYKMPELSDSLRLQLQNLSDKELQELMDDENKLLQMLGSLPEVVQLTRDQEHYVELNEKLARSNLAMKPLLEEKKKTLLEKYDHFNEVKAEYDKNAEKQEQLRQSYDIRHIQDNLKVAALQAEEESENIAEDFLEGKLTVEEFKKNYMDKRKLSHLRHAKEERLEQLRTVIY